MIKKLIILATVVQLPLLASAHEDQENPEVRYRHTIMEAMSNHVAAMAMILKNEVNRADEMQVSARALAESASLIGGLFPENSKGAAALPLIWEEPEKVATASRRMAEAANGLAEAAAGGTRSDIARAFKTVADGCKGCHERYKEED